MTSRAIPLPAPIRVAFLALAVALGSVAVAYAQTASVESLSSRLDPQTSAAVRSLIESAAAQGVPGEPLVAKALEGQSKGAPGERIVAAVRRLGADLAAAHNALGASVTSSEIVAGAGALRSGASVDVLRQVKAARGTQSTLLPLATLTDLVARGVPVERATQTVLALAERGASEADYRAQTSARGPGEAGRGPPSGPPAPAAPPPTPGVGVPGSPPPGERPNPRPR